MSKSDELGPVVEKIDLLMAELRLLRSSGPHFRILHRFREPGTDCAPGEEIVAVFLVFRGRAMFVPLSLALRLFFDFLARHSHLPQSAAQIAAAVRVDPFCRKHGTNAPSGATLTRKMSRSSIKEFVKRVRQALALVFLEAGLAIDPNTVLRSENTVTNEVGYRIQASFEWAHLD